MRRALPLASLAACLLAPPTRAAGPVPTPQKLLDRETFWDNRDWDWYGDNVTCVVFSTPARPGVG